MDCANYLNNTELRLKKVNIPTARLDVLVLLEDVVGKDRSWILAHPEYELSKQQVATLEEQIDRRCNHEPLAYIRGKSEFYGHEFQVNEHTLEPRPESESIIDLLKRLKQPKIVVDVGTGSGCLAITASLELPGNKVYATDIDNKCIQTAKANAKNHGVSIDFRRGNLLEPLLNDLAALVEWAILANLPYVPDTHTINKAAMFEPRHAIFGGPDGLDLYRQMFRQIDQLEQKPIYVLTESLPFQHEDLAKIASLSGYKQIEKEDFIQVFQLS